MTKVFVHGNPETDAIWRPLTDALSARGVDDVVLLSPPGFGAPTPEGWDALPASYVGWLADELEGLGGEIDLVGHDWGAGHVYGLVADRPELLRSWAADVAGLMHADYVWHDAAQTWQQPEAGEAAIEMMTSLTDADRATAYGGLGLPDDVAASLAVAFDDEMGRCILALYRAATTEALAEIADRLAARTHSNGLIIDPSDDPYVASALAAPVAERLGAGMLPLDGQGHWWMVSDPDGAAAGLIDFWNSL